MGDKCEEPKGRRPLRPSDKDKAFDPAPNRILVFGSNKAGIHAVGARRYAYTWCGAEWEVGEGLVGNSYAIPTRGHRLHIVLKLEEIKQHVETFILFAWEHRELEFFVTRLGCDPEEYTDEELATLFRDAPPNCELPEQWKRILSRSGDGGEYLCGAAQSNQTP
jgi:hypothetical protein